jgi:hypothetical protein
MNEHGTRLKSCQFAALAVCAAGIVLSAVLSWQTPDRLWKAYLFAYLTCWLVVMGGMGLLALGSATGGRWAQAGRPYYRSLLQTVPLVAILFLPIAINLDLIYPWAAQSTASERGLTLTTTQAMYLNQPFFFGRAVAYFVIWMGIAFILGWQTRPLRTAADAPRAAAGRTGAVTLVLLVPTVTFAAFDWAMSLEPRWYSSIYGAILTAGGVLAAHALAIIGATVPTSGETPNTEVADVSNDFGNLLLAFLMVFTYFSFSQFLIIWFGNLPSEITWYARRLQDGWQWLALTLVIFHFVVPFLLLLSRDVKRSPPKLAKVAAFLLVMFAVNIYWTVAPALAESGPIWVATNLATLAALAGGLLAVVCWHARRYLWAAVDGNSVREYT